MSNGILLSPPSGAIELFSSLQGEFMVVPDTKAEVALNDPLVDYVVFFNWGLLNKHIPKHDFTLDASAEYRVFPYNYPSNLKLILCLPPFLSPSNKVERIRAAKAIAFLKQALENFSTLQIPIPSSDDVEILTTDNEAIRWIDECTGCICALDYETTGLNCYKYHSKHRIVSAAIATYLNGRWVSKAFNFYLNNTEFVYYFQRFLRESKLIIHNYQFEADWSIIKCEQAIDHLWWDTMIAQHCIDNNATVALKLWVYLYFGIIYEVPGDISADMDGEFNGFVNFPIGATPTKVLYYNALDSLYTGWLYDKQVAFFKNYPTLQKGLDLFLDAVQELWFAHYKGIRIDPEQLKAAFNVAAEVKNEVLQKIYMHPWLQKWKKGQMWDLTKASNIKEIVKLNTGADMESVDEEALNKIGGDFVELILEYRKNEKFATTYLSGFARELAGDIIHPLYHLERVKTFRTSASNPNFQNIPKRGKITKAVRSMFLPSRGNIMVEWDYKGVEVAIGACYHKDPEMMRYLETPGTDMHRDTAAVLFKKQASDVTKDERQISKNMFVFPIFYGASFKSMSKDLWESMNADQRKQLGPTFAKFEQHIKAVEENWWKVRFPVFGRWRQEVFAEFEQKGELEYYTGFRVLGPAGFTQLVNRPIQGSACHCLLKCLTNAAPQMRKLSGRSHIIGQIHDSIIGDIHPSELDACNEIVRQEGIVKLKAAWSWIIAPLEIEYGVSPVDGSWADIKEVGKLV